MSNSGPVGIPGAVGINETPRTIREKSITEHTTTEMIIPEFWVLFWRCPKCSNHMILRSDQWYDYCPKCGTRSCLSITATVTAKER